MDTEDFISGPHRVDQPPAGLGAALADLIGRVTVAGGVTGFTSATELSTIRQRADEIVADVGARPKSRHLLIMGQEHALAGAVVLRLEALPVRAHRAEIEWLLVDPAMQRRGLGTQLLDAAVSHLRAVGVTHAQLTTRSGEGLSEYYRARGWTERGRWPRSLCVDEQDWRDQVWLCREV